MIRRLSLATVLCITTSAVAQELSVTQYPALGDNLLVHTGDFAASPSLVEINRACLNNDSNIRRQIRAVEFDPPFKAKPQVILSLTALDFDTDRNIRVSAFVQNATRDGMTVVVQTWCNSNLHAASGSFIAVGQKDQ